MGHSPVFAPFFKIVRFLRHGNFDATENLYVATTGSDSNNGITPATAFLTIGKAIQTIAASSQAGPLIINLADGTYNENVIAQNALTATTDMPILALTGANLIKIIGNPTTPANVIIQGSGSSTFAFNVISTCYILDGMTIRNTGAAGTIGITCQRANRLILRNVNIENVRFGIAAINYSAIVIEDTPNGGSIDASEIGISLTIASTIDTVRALTITGVTIDGIICQGESRAAFSNNLTVTAGVGGAFFGLLAQRHGRFAFSNGSTYSFTGFNLAATSTGINLSQKAMAVAAGSASIYNFTNCTIPIRILDDSTFITGAHTFNYLGTTPATVNLSPGSSALSANVFGGATIASQEDDTDYKYGDDFRYTTPVFGIHNGLRPAFSSNLTYDQATTDEFPLYTAQQDERVDKLQVRTQIAPGGAVTDVYTVLKNGLVTTMTLSIVGASLTGSTTTNPVTLAAGDRIGITVAPGGGSVTETITAQMTVRKT